MTLAARLALALVLPLTEDEAYYRLWAQSPAFGYFDHPPMIAWWIWIGRHVAGDSSLGVRLTSIFSCALTSVLVVDLAGMAGANRSKAALAGVLYNAMPLVLLGGFLAVPDAPATLFWTATLCALMRAVRGPALGWWLAAGIGAGLAALSKYSALFLAPGTLLWLASTREGRSSLQKPGPWLAAGLAALVFSANVGWNATHHWVTFAKQFGRVAPGRLAPRYLLELLATQALLTNPLILGLAVRGVAYAPGDGSTRAAAGRLAAFGAPFALYLLLHSLHDRVQGHWPAPLYPLIAICAAFGLSVEGRGSPWTGLVRGALVLGFAAGLAALTLLAIPPDRLTAGADLALPLRGWPSFAARIEQMRGASSAAWVGTLSYGTAALLADRPEVRSPVVELREPMRWQGLPAEPRADFSKPGLVVDLARRVDGARLSACFTEVRPLGSLTRGGMGERGTIYLVFLVRRLRGNVPVPAC